MKTAKSHFFTKIEGKNSLQKINKENMGGNSKYHDSGILERANYGEFHTGIICAINKEEII